MSEAPRDPPGVERCRGYYGAIQPGDRFALVKEPPIELHVAVLGWWNGLECNGGIVYYPFDSRGSFGEGGIARERWFRDRIVGLLPPCPPDRLEALRMHQAREAAEVSERVHRETAEVEERRLARERREAAEREARRLSGRPRGLLARLLGGCRA